MVHMLLLLEFSAHSCWLLAVRVYQQEQALSESLEEACGWGLRKIHCGDTLWVSVPTAWLTHCPGNSLVDSWRMTVFCHSTSKQDHCLGQILATLIWCWAAFLLAVLLVHWSSLSKKEYYLRCKNGLGGEGEGTVRLGRSHASSFALFLKFCVFLRVITELYVRLCLT